MFLFHREIIFCSRYSSFSIFNYPIIYQICNVMISISTWGSAFFSASSGKNLGTSISAGCLGWCCKYNTIITLILAENVSYLALIQAVFRIGDCFWARENQSLKNWKIIFVQGMYYSLKAHAHFTPHCSHTLSNLKSR